MKMIDHNHFICHLILGTFTEYPSIIQLNQPSSLCVSVRNYFSGVFASVAVRKS